MILTLKTRKAMTSFEVLTILIITLLFGCGQENDNSTKAPPNVLMISVDDMNDWVGYLNGYPGVKTPNIDRLAKSSVAFMDAHCPSPKCGPSRTAILTGMLPSTTGIYDNDQWWAPNLPDVVTMPLHFMNNGYKALGAGKVFHHTGGNNPPSNWDEYFDQVFDDVWDKRVQSNYLKIDPPPFPDSIPLNGIRPHQHELDWGPLYEDPMAYGDAKAVEWGLSQLQKSHEKPFFLAVGLFHPHLPWYAPSEFFHEYSIEEIVTPDTIENDLDDIPEVGLELAAAGRETLRKIVASDKYREAIKAYLANITYADYLVGKLLDGLEMSKYAGNTIVVLWSDHGWHLGEKQHWYKSTLWQRATHVPFMIQVPGLNPRKVNTPVNLIDLYPTLSELCQLSENTELEGNDLTLLLNGSEGKDSTTLITFRKGNHAIHDSRWRYIRYHDGGEELYDHSNDPNECINLANEPKYFSIIESMKSFLPEVNAEPKPAKSAFIFNPDTYNWTTK